MWNRIVDELAFFQDKSKGSADGAVINPISNTVCTQDTACAAEVFATEYINTKNNDWLVRAKSAITALLKYNLYAGLDEPRWDPIGWHSNKGSLYITGTVLDAYWRATRLTGMDLVEDNWTDLSHFIQSCMLGYGGFAHDAIVSGRKPADVQNITAIASYLIEYVCKNGSLTLQLANERDNILNHITKGQSTDGLWPYIYPGFGQTLLYKIYFLRRSSLYRRFIYKFLGDRSIFFGDSVHHMYVLYYFINAILLRDHVSKKQYNAVVKGWEWIEKRLQKNSDGSVSFDFSWEPKPAVVRFCNFCDTTTYFLILALIPLLRGLGLSGTRMSFADLESGFIKHVAANLLDAEGKYPSIKPHEGPIDTLQKILPAIWQGVAWKGALLSRHIRYYKKIDGQEDFI